MNKKKLKTALIVLIILISLILCVNVVVYAAYALAATEVSYTKSDGTTVSVKAALDELNTKVPKKSIGDEVTVGGEKFYVLEWDNNSDTVNLIAKYNLNSAGTAQSSSQVYCMFSSTNYWRDGFKSSPYNVNDCTGFNSTDVLGKAKSYGISKGAVASRLLSYEEANALKTRSSSNSKIKRMYVNGQTYWLGSASSVMNVWVTDKNGSIRSCGYNNPNYQRTRCSGLWEDVPGVRSVITVLKSSIS